MKPLVEATGVTRAFGTGADVVHALRGVDLSIAAGEHVAIIGKSGAGKSTLLQLIGALDRGYGGSMRVDGHELRELGDKQLSALRNRVIGFVFQSFNLLPNLSVGANLVLPAYFGAGESAEKRARELLARVGLADKWRSKPLTLSGGERQRVAIARALLLRPRLLICDEPTGSLDEGTSAEIMALFDEVRSQTGCALVMVTHDRAVAARAQRVVELHAGQIVADQPISAWAGTPESESAGSA